MPVAAWNPTLEDPEKNLERTRQMAGQGILVIALNVTFNTVLKGPCMRMIDSTDDTECGRAWRDRARETML